MNGMNTQDGFALGSIMAEQEWGRGVPVRDLTGKDDPRKRRKSKDVSNLMGEMRRSSWGSRAWKSPARTDGGSVRTGSITVKDFELNGVDNGQMVVLLIPHIRAREDGSVALLDPDTAKDVALEKQDYVVVGRAPDGSEKELEELTTLATSASKGFSKLMEDAPSATFADIDATEHVPAKTISTGYAHEKMDHWPSIYRPGVARK